MRLQGKVALISGAARGQGAAEARLFAKEGAKVVLTDVLDAEGRKVAAEIGESGGDAVYMHLDVTNENEWKKVVADTVKRFGKVDVLVNNAGIWRGGTVESTTTDTWDQVMDINAKGVFLGSKYTIPEMRKAGGGSIINISSVAGFRGGRNSTAYTTSKGAVRLLTKSTAVQYGKDGIRCNSIHPGPIDTDMLADIRAQGVGGAQQQLPVSQRLPLGRVGEAAEAGDVIAFLASERASYLTGIAINIDAGSSPVI
jgi:NAD(P)-dependent dehydrogenase (short-subunit alcohol dehydrogenase family)